MSILSFGFEEEALNDGSKQSQKLLYLAGLIWPQGLRENKVLGKG